MTDSTDNARGPERIWAESKTCTVDASGASRLLAMDREFSRGTEYIRADLAPDPLRAVKVKPLEWKMNHRHEQSASGYVVLPHPCAINLWCLDVFGRRQDTDFPSPEAAKAAAQALHEASVRSALEPADVMADPRVVALADALRFYAEGNWPDSYPGGVTYEEHGVTCLDYGDNARAALAALSPTGGNADG